MNFAFHHIQHVGIPVTDITTSEAFYKRLGFDNVTQSSFDHNGAKGQMIMMKRGEIVMEIYQMPDAELPAIKNRKDGHVDHIAFDVEDIDAAFKELKIEGFTVVEEAPVFLPFWSHGCKYFNILGPDGERLEFNQIL